MIGDKSSRCKPALTFPQIHFHPESRIKRTLFGVYSQVFQEEVVSGHRFGGPLIAAHDSLYLCGFDTAEPIGTSDLLPSQKQRRKSRHNERLKFHPDSPLSYFSPFPSKYDVYQVNFLLFFPL